MLLSLIIIRGRVELVTDLKEVNIPGNLPDFHYIAGYSLSYPPSSFT